MKGIPPCPATYKELAKYPTRLSKSWKKSPMNLILYHLDSRWILKWSGNVIYEEHFFFVRIYFVTIVEIFRSRNSFPPVRHLLPYQHIMRSFSDSQLSLRITTGSCTLSPFKSSSNKCHHQPLLPLKFSSLLEVALKEENTEDGFSFCSSDLLDSEYIQQWLLLDEKRSAMQHLQMEYNTAEVEDWSMEDTENWKKITRLIFSSANFKRFLMNIFLLYMEFIS